MEIEAIRELIVLMRANGIRAIDWKTENGHIKLKSQTAEGHAGGGGKAGSAPSAAPAAPEDGEPEESAEAIEGRVIASPIVGTFYSSPSPDKPGFVEVGATVEPSTVVCIVEAMKVMNEIRAETSGKIKKVLVENGQAVEYGQPLFELE